MTDLEIEQKIIKGLALTTQKLVSQKRAAKGQLVVYENGQVKKLKADQIKIFNRS